jgi:hypothetical protein
LNCRLSCPHKHLLVNEDTEVVYLDRAPHSAVLAGQSGHFDKFWTLKLSVWDELLVQR